MFRYIALVVCVFQITVPNMVSANEALRLGDSGPAVYELQKNLNQLLDEPIALSGAGAPGNETDYFGRATYEAVKRLQQKYATEILLPSGLVSPTGIFGPATKRFIDQRLILPNASATADIANTARSQLSGTSQLFTRPWHQQKKGFGIWTSSFYPNARRDNLALQKVNLIKPYWYYTWELIPLPGVDISILHVPMIWQSPGYRTATGPCLLERFYPTTRSMMSTLRAQVASQGKKYSLVFLQNEPNHPSSCMTVEQGVSFAFNHQDGLREVSNAVISPVSTQPADLVTGKIPWLDAYLRDSKLPKNLISRIAYHHYPDPVALGFIPPTANPLNPNDPFYSNKDNVGIVAEKLAADFLDRLHMAYRQYGLPIWVKEFNVYDWGARIDCTQFPAHLCPADNAKRPNSRISEEVVVRFLEIVLPEMDKRSYIQRYALFAPELSSKEAERSKAGSVFVVDKNNTVTLTKVGALYAKHQSNSSCIVGEFKLGNSFVEWQDMSCGSAPKGWKTNTKDNRYENVVLARQNSPSHLLRSK